MKSPILLIGGGGHCKSLIDVIEQEGRYRIAGILDQQKRIGEKVFGYEIIGCDDDLQKLVLTIKHAVIAIGQITAADTRIELYNCLCALGFELPTIISPRAYVSSHALVGKGTVIMHDVLINAGATVGDNCIINTKALIEHDARIEDHCHISTASVVNGGACIKTGSFFGSNAVSKEYATIMPNSFIKAGNVVK